MHMNSNKLTNAYIAATPKTLKPTMHVSTGSNLIGVPVNQWGRLSSPSTGARFLFQVDSSHVSSEAPPKIAPILKPSSFRCNASADHLDGQRSGNHKPSFWDFDYIHALNSTYTEERYLRRASELKLEVKRLLEEAADQLELIDDLQRLGISCHFEDKIKKILSSVYEQKYGENYDAKEIRDLNNTALEFRLLRQHGFDVTEEVFECFKNENGNFKPSLKDDTRGLLQMYEASFLSTPGEETLEQAREFTMEFLKKKLEDISSPKINENIALLVRHALDMPTHWRAQRPNARLYIDTYGRGPNPNPIVLEFAKLDFNILQATHQEELKHFLRWWKSTHLTKKLPLTRDRLVESILWSRGFFDARECGYQRIISTKILSLLLAVDDIFDIYGTMEELHLFTEAFQQWDVESIDQLPDYMQLCFLALDKFVNEFAYDVLKEQGAFIIPYLRKKLIDLVEAYLQEAEWYYGGHTPTLEDYLKNGWISSTAPAVLYHLYFIVGNPLDHNNPSENLHQYHEIVRQASIIMRLMNDIGTYPVELKRGDVQKSIQCYMNESGVSEEEATEHIRFLIRKTWEKMNKEVADCELSQDFITCVVKATQMSHYIYQYRDEPGVQNSNIKDQITALFFRSIPYSLYSKEDM